MPAAVTVCPHPLDTRTPRVPENLAYSLTLPAALASPAVARSAARTILEAHGLDDVTAAAVQVVGELAACACLFTPDDNVYLSLRYRDDALRISLYDGHPRHTHRRLAAACDGRRRSVLLLLACVMHACDGEWGFGESPQPGDGTRLWAVLPRAGARAYGQAACANRSPGAVPGDPSRTAAAAAALLSAGRPAACHRCSCS